MSFLWDVLKAKSNYQKHKVSFEEAQCVFADPLAVTFDDLVHSVQEQREIIIGNSNQGRLLFVCFAEYNSIVRLISARDATRQERKNYENNISF
jgi:uncharacterized DUF497 family protein